MKLHIKVLNKEILLKLLFGGIAGSIAHFMFQSILISAGIFILTLFILTKGERSIGSHFFLKENEDQKSYENFRLRNIRFSEICPEKEILPH